MFKTLLRCMSLSLIPVGISGALMGTAAAALMGNADVILATFCVLFAVFAQIAANLVHRYSEYTLNGEGNDVFTADMLDNRYSTPVVIRESIFAFSVLSALIGLPIWILGGWWMLVVALVLVGLVYVYNNPRHPLSRTPFAIIVAFLAFGPIEVVVTCFIQAAHGAADPYTWLDLGPAVMLGVISGQLAVNCLLAHNFKFYETDITHHRQTFVVTWGKKTSLGVYFLNVAMIWLVCLFGCFQFKMSNLMLDMIVPTALTIANVFFGLRLAKGGKYVGKMQGYLALTMLIFSVLCLVNFIIIGKPDDSTTTIFGRMAFLMP